MLNVDYLIRGKVDTKELAVFLRGNPDTIVYDEKKGTFFVWCSVNQKFLWCNPNNQVQKWWYEAKGLQDWYNRVMKEQKEKEESGKRDKWTYIPFLHFDDCELLPF